VLLGVSSSQVPVGTGNFALATAISGSCTAGICSFSDSQAAAASYTVGADPTLILQLDEWPGHIVLSPSTDAANTFALPQYFADILPANASSVMVAAGNAPSFYAHGCTSQEFPSIAQQVCSPLNSTQSAVITSGAPFPQGGGSTSILQGSLLFQGSPATPNHFITLYDSQQQKTLSNIGRLAASVNDVFIGTDDTAGNFRNLSFGAPQAISFYIGNTGDNSSYLERLTSSNKAFNVPVTTNSQITSTVATGTAPLVVSSQTRVPNLTTGGNPSLINCGTTTSCSNSLLLNGYVVKGSVALSAGSANIHGLPFTSTAFICVTGDNTTATNGSKMVETGNTTATATGTGTDVIAYICGGN